MNLTTKNAQFELKELNEDGTFTGYASVFGVVDLGLDVIHKGAFKKTLQERKNVRMLWQHDQHQPIGVYTKVAEDDHGLMVEGKIALDVQKGKEAYSLLKMGAMDGMSIGYSVVKDEMDNTTGIRNIKELKLYEVSLVTFPMNTSSTVTAVKSATDDLDAEQMEKLIKYAASLRSDQEPTKTSEVVFNGVKYNLDTTESKHSDTIEAEAKHDDEPLNALVDQFKSILENKEE